MVAADLGTLVAASDPHTPGTTVSKDVTLALSDDYANLGTRYSASSYRLQFAGAPNADNVNDLIQISTSSTVSTLTVKYLYP